MLELKQNFLGYGKCQKIIQLQNKHCITSNNPTMSLQLISKVTGILKPTDVLTVALRHASKKTGGSTRNPKGHARPKHRGWKVQDGHYVSAGSILATQLTPRFHPGLNVGFGKNGTLFALEHGKVVITCEKTDLNWDHTWVQRHYAGRQDQTIYKKYFNVIPEKQHQRFKLIDEI